MNYRKSYSHKNGIVTKVHSRSNDLIEFTISIKDFYYPNKTKQDVITYIDCQIIAPNPYVFDMIQENTLVSLTGHDLTDVLYLNNRAYNYNVLNVTDARVYGSLNKESYD